METVISSLDDAYWQGRYETGRDGWDAHGITPPLREYFDQLDVATQPRILIPGAGRGYEAEYLHQRGFRNVFVADFAPEAITALSLRVLDFPAEHLLLSDFFELPGEGKLDYIIEQTFFCAIDPVLRPAYAKQCAALLRRGGTLAGLLFDTQFENKAEPPFGGNREEYIEYFAPYFEFQHFETAYNSLRPRQGKELFINLKKK